MRIHRRSRARMWKPRCAPAGRKRKWPKPCMSRRFLPPSIASLTALDCRLPILTVCKAKMSEPSNPRRPKRGTWTPQPETAALLRVSGNSINGLGETVPRRPSPFFWHPPDQHPFGDLQLLARKNSRKCPGSTEAFQGAYTYPELITVAETRNESPAVELAE